MTGTPLETLSALTGDGWLVGGALRDELLGRSTTDFDVVVPGEAKPLAVELGRRAGGHPFPLSESFGAWRVIAHDHGWQVDLTPLMGETLDDDLARRDLTINALARPLRASELIDRHGGIADLGARRLRMVSDTAFAGDPLRIVRLARLAAQLDFVVDPATAQAATAAAPALGATAAERVFAELRLIVAGDRAPDGLRLLDRLGATGVVIPELTALQGVEQSDYHHLDVYGHTLEVLERAIALQADPGAVFPAHAEPLAAFLAEPLANELTRGDALRFGALFHDIAKASTRAVSAEGRVTFFGHDRAGAEAATEILTRLRASDRLAGHVAALTRHHLRLGFLVHVAPLGRHDLYRYLRTCEPVEVDVTLLSVADRLATRGRNAEAAIERHLELARSLLDDALRWRADPPKPPIRGDRLAAALAIERGPALGELLEQLTEAAYAGEVTGAEDAVAWARARGADR